MKPRIIFRTDGNGQIGLGHLTRCFAVSHMLKHEFEIIFACQHIPEQLVREASSFGLVIKRIQQNTDIFLFLRSSDIVVLDGYAFDGDYEKSIKANGNLLVVIDDLHEREFFADLIINPVPCAAESDYSGQKYTKYALGLEYVLLRQSFLNVAENRTRKAGKKSKNILICFGGADPKNLTLQVLESVIDDNRFDRVTAVTGCAYHFSDTLSHLTQRYPHVEVHNCLDEHKMVEFMKDADVAVVPASGILFEAIAVGCKVVSGMYMDNQRFVYGQFLDKGLISDAGSFGKSEIKNAIDNVYRMDNSAYQPIDGLSGERILKLFKGLEARTKVSLRRATISDIDLTFCWANDPNVRKYSFAKHEITKIEHEKWFTSKINDLSCLYYILLIDDKAAGSIRFDIEAGSAVISYLLDPKYHGKGYGSLLIEEGEKHLKAEGQKMNFSVLKLVGVVDSNNHPSLKIFRQLGYSEIIDRKSIKFEKKIKI